MKKKLLRMLFFLWIGVQAVSGQVLTHPWKVIDQGGGRSGAGSIILQGSIGQAAVQRMVYIDTGTVLESGYIPGVRFLSGSSLWLSVMQEANWNMLSIPLIVSDYHKRVLYPTAISAAFLYDGGYKTGDSLLNGAGFWLKFPGAGVVMMPGRGLTLDTVGVKNKWNMVGSLSYPVLASSVVPVAPVTLTSFFYGFSNVGGYFKADTLKPGYGYWVKASSDGRLVMQTGSLLASKGPALAAVRGKSSGPSGEVTGTAGEEPGTVVFTDAEGRQRTVYFSAKESNLGEYDLPPVPPLGIFDVRYSSQRSLEAVNENAQKEASLTISSAKYPLTVRWESGRLAKASLVIDGKVIPLEGKGTVQIAKPALEVRLRLSQSGSVPIPKSYALRQNYPNPFNPTTTIRYDLPADAHVVLRIYNTLGQAVRTVMDEVQAAGYRSVEWNSQNDAGNHAASGIYFYRLDATSLSAPVKTFTDTHKMILIR